MGYKYDIKEISDQGSIKNLTSDPPRIKAKVVFYDEVIDIDTQKDCFYPMLYTIEDIDNDEQYKALIYICKDLDKCGYSTVIVELDFETNMPINFMIDEYF